MLAGDEGGDGTISLVVLIGSDPIGIRAMELLMEELLGDLHHLLVLAYPNRHILIF